MRFKNQIAVVTGASSGIGRAVSERLGSEGATVCLLGRNEDALKSVVQSMPTVKDRFKICGIDLERDADLMGFRNRVEREFEHIDILVHSAGIFSMGKLEDSSVEDLDRQYRVNVRAPYLLTQHLLPMVRSCRGQIVFVNSSAGMNAKAKVSQYSATKHAIKAIADSLRAEINDCGVRVLSIFPGTTATPMQAMIHRLEGREYIPERLMQPQDVAEVLMCALMVPRSAEITDISMRPLQKS